jgi:hypothetical protein
MTRPKRDQDETQKRPLRPERDQKETYSRPKRDLFATSACIFSVKVLCVLEDKIKLEG